MPSFNQELITRLYKSMLLIRKVEELIVNVYHTDAVKSPVHLSIGQEAVATGVCDILQHDDLVSNTYRCHATYLAKGGNLKEMIAELYGKKTGCAGGKAGSMHLIDIPNGVLGASAVVGTTIPVATGYALALKKNKIRTGKQNIVTAFFGDGATEEGCFSESINFAALHKLPILYVCENNYYAIHSPIENRWPTNNLRARVETYGIPTEFINDGDIFKIRETTEKLIEEVRNGNGPRFIEIMTYRFKQHVGPSDDTASYRDIKLYKQWEENDQIKKLEGLLSANILTKIQNEVESEIEAARIFAENSPFPTERDLYGNVYAN